MGSVSTDQAIADGAGSPTRRSATRPELAAPLGAGTGLRGLSQGIGSVLVSRNKCGTGPVRGLPRSWMREEARMFRPGSMIFLRGRELTAVLLSCAGGDNSLCRHPRQCLTTHE
ncbi:hypothetical protein TPA0909_25700 [Streptomyces albus]|nr:hypothetical protein TPA0909_25700 [Streptomyces albus]